MSPRERHPDPRHAAVRAALTEYWLRENPGATELPWGPADAGALAMLLRADPTLDLATVEQCLRHRLQSEDHAAGERVYVWIGNLLRYRVAPLDRFRLPKRVRPEAVVGMESQVGEREPMSAAARARWVKRAQERRSKGLPLADWEAQMLREEGLL